MKGLIMMRTVTRALVGGALAAPLVFGMPAVALAGDGGGYDNPVRQMQSNATEQNNTSTNKVNANQTSHHNKGDTTQSVTNENPQSNTNATYQAQLEDSKVKIEGASEEGSSK